jgi:hypothetical protein
LRGKYEAEVQLARSELPPHRLDVADSDLVELDLGQGIHLWSSVERLRRDFGAQGSRDAKATDAVEIPHSLSIGGPSRGAGAWVIKGLKIFGVDIAEDITDFVSSKVESGLLPGPGLYRCTSRSALDMQALGAGGRALDPQRPTVVFIHGTASSTEGSFGGLWQGDGRGRINQLLDSYQGQVLARQHRTLTESPLENALELVWALPKSALLHLVSHSRAGIQSRPGLDPRRALHPGLVAFGGENREGGRLIRDRLRSTQLKKWKKPWKFQRIMIATGLDPPHPRRTWVKMNR